MLAKWPNKLKQNKKSWLKRPTKSEMSVKKVNKIVIAKQVNKIFSKADPINLAQFIVRRVWHTRMGGRPA